MLPNQARSCVCCPQPSTRATGRRYEGNALAAAAWCAQDIAARHGIPASPSHPVLLVTDNIDARQSIAAGRYGPNVSTPTNKPLHFMNVHPGAGRRRQRRQLLLLGGKAAAGALVGPLGGERQTGGLVAGALTALRAAKQHPEQAALVGREGRWRVQRRSLLPDALDAALDALKAAHVATMAEMYVLANAKCLVWCRSGFSELAMTWGFPA